MSEAWAWTTVGLKLLAVVGLVLMNGFFVATEFALVKIRQTQLLPLEARGQRRARMALHLVRHLDAYLSACQLGITLASLGLGWIGEPVFAFLLQPVFGWLDVESPAARESLAFGVGFSAITFLHIVVGEMAPKSLAIRKALPVSLWVAYPMHWFYVVMYPAIWLLNEAALGLLRWLGIEPMVEAESIRSEEELRLVVAASQQRMGASRFSRELVQNALSLRHRVVRDVMRPRHEIVALDTTAGISECLSVAEQSRYSRFPICEEGDLDRTLGVIHIKDLYATRLKARTAADLLPVAHPLLYVPEVGHLERLLRLFLERRLHMAIVVDEYGTTVGLVTLENVLEELVGPIQDEFDQEKPVLSRMGESVWEAAGTLPLHELADLLGETLHVPGLATASGWLTHRLGGFPNPGDVIELAGWRLRVLETEGGRVTRFRIERLTAAGSEPTSRPVGRDGQG
ncbi:MAG: hemolysin family protein [Verrucomicrobiota bacterium]|nr:hemolysin family protein [Limisphaera sp.]MDW8382015.1 hemolysin family protein [Verrucomicrobiota bacterium]